MKLTKGKLKDYEVVFETEGETVDICCRNCDYTRWQIFFIKDYSDKDIGEACPRCKGELYIKGPSSTDKIPKREDIKKVLEEPDFIKKYKGGSYE